MSDRHYTPPLSCPYLNYNLVNMATTSRTIALVTGANQGIGLAIAQILSSDHGYHVILSGRRERAVQEAVEQLRMKGLDVEPLVLDLDSDQSIEAAVNYVEQSVYRFPISF
jgi:NAD(P)-dependent dehydrogenase (short-subunit alcohol dehydrogenase family)